MSNVNPNPRRKAFVDRHGAGPAQRVAMRKDLDALIEAELREEAQERKAAYECLFKIELAARAYYLGIGSIDELGKSLGLKS